MALRKRLDAKTVFSAVASVAASAMLVKSIANEFFPQDIRNVYFSGLHSLLQRFSSQFTVVIDQFRGFSTNQVFEAADTYLGTKVTSSSQRVKIGKVENEKCFTLSVDQDEEITDTFEEFQVKWMLRCEQIESSGRHPRDTNSSLRSEARSYQLTFHKKYKDRVLSAYLPYVLERAKEIKQGGKAIQLHTVNYGSIWQSNVINLEHPMTFKTLAMDAELKEKLLEDLESFVNGKEFYRRIGKAWKRGYLLYGPPGTGKSSLIACIANHLNYDIYDLDLTEVQSNSDLRGLLLSMSSKSVLVIEDIDCNLKLKDREIAEQSTTTDDTNKLTLSGVLNFIDGLLSCCGDERIFIFTTNHKDSLDPALLRPGRMDMHIHMSYCSFSAFKQLASNYLGIVDHQLFPEIKRLIGEAEATPAEIAGELIKGKDTTTSLVSLVAFLNKKISKVD